MYIYIYIYAYTYVYVSIIVKYEVIIIRNIHHSIIVIILCYMYYTCMNIAYVHTHVYSYVGM